MRHRNRPRAASAERPLSTIQTDATPEGRDPRRGISETRSAARQPTERRSCVRERSQSRGVAEPPSERRRGLPSECGSRLRRSADSPERAGNARVRGASRCDRQVKLLALPLITVARRLGRQHQSESVDDVRARLLTRTPLTEDALHLRNRRDHPALFTWLKNDRDCKLLRHRRNDSGSCQAPTRPRQGQPRRTSNGSVRVNRPLTGSRSREIAPTTALGYTPGRAARSHHRGSSVATMARNVRCPKRWSTLSQGSHTRSTPARRSARPRSRFATASRTKTRRPSIANMVSVTGEVATLSCT